MSVGTVGKGLFFTDSLQEGVLKIGPLVNVHS